MDNLPCHKVPAGIRKEIEQAFAKLTGLLRKAGERTRDGLWNAIAHILKLYSPAECRNLFDIQAIVPDRE